MWYDKYPGVPPRGSPLEALFVLVHLQRTEIELQAQRTQVRGMMAQTVKGTETMKAAIESYDAYCAALMPFLEGAKGADFLGKDRKNLLEHVKYPMQIDLVALRAAMGAEAKKKGLQKFKVQEKKT